MTAPPAPVPSAAAAGTDGDSGILLRVDLRGQRVAGVGAGPVAAAKLLPLCDAGAHVEVVAPDACDALREVAERGGLVWHRRRYRTGDLDGALLAVAATDDPATNAQVAADAAATATLCVRTDGGGVAAFCATVRRGPVQLGVSTAGNAPALARQLRAELAERYGPEYGELAVVLGELRRDDEVRKVLTAVPPDERAARWRRALGADILTALRNGQPDHAREMARLCLCSSSD